MIEMFGERPERFELPTFWFVAMRSTTSFQFMAAGAPWNDYKLAKGEELPCPFVRVIVRELRTTPSKTSLKQFPSRADFIGSCCTACVGAYLIFSLITRRSSVQI